MQQAATLNVHGRYLHEGVIEYVERLVSLHHGGIQSAILGCSGTEATEMALTLARSVTGKQGIICTDSTYHGNSSLVGRLTALPVGNDRGGVKSITTPQLFRPMAEGVSEAELLQLHLDQLEATIASFADSGGFAGIMLCSILANEGLAIPPSGWFAEATAMVSDAGGVVIADEVQSGLPAADLGGVMKSAASHPMLCAWVNPWVTVFLFLQWRRAMKWSQNFGSDIVTSIRLLLHHFKQQRVAR